MARKSDHHSRTRIAFGDCEIDLAARRLSRAGAEVPVQNRPFQLLIYLIANRDRVVPREELIREVWRSVRVSPQSQRYALNAARAAIGDNGREQRYIRTIPRVGVRFVAEVTELHARDADSSDSAQNSPDGSFFVGREELIQLVENLVGATNSRGLQGLLLRGEPGIGKSTSLSQIAHCAKRLGLLNLQARCGESIDEPALWPVIQILRSACSQIKPMNLHPILTRSEEVAWLVRDDQLSLGRSESALASDPRTARSRLFEGVSAFLRAVSFNQALAICIDDLHRSDNETLRLLTYLIRSLARRPVLFAASYRDSELACTPGLRSFLTETSIERKFTNYELPRLTKHCVHSLTVKSINVKPSKEAIDDLYQKTSGNPFFLTQIFRALKRDRREHLVASKCKLDVHIPADLAHLIQSWLQSLAPSVRSLIEAAAVAGREFVGLEVQRALRIGPLALSRRIQAGKDSGVIVECEDPMRFRFVHALVRDAAYEGLSTARRSALHLALARSIESVLDMSVGSRAAELARHYNSGPSSEAVHAIHYLRRAADWDSQNAAFEQAAEHLKRALQLYSDLGICNAEVLCELLLHLGRTLAMNSGRAESRRCLGEAAAIAGKIGRGDLYAEAALEFSPDLLAIETGILDIELVDLLQNALMLLDQSSSPHRSRVLARLAVALHWSDERYDEISPLVRESVSTAQDQESQEYAKAAGRIALYSVDKAETRVGRLITSYTRETALPDLLLRITGLMQLGRLREAEIAISTFEDIAKKLLRPSAAWYGDMLRATLAQLRGTYDEASARRSRFLAAGLRVSDANAVHSYALQAVMEAIDVGGLEQAEASVIDMAREFPRVDGWQAGLCYLYFEVGRHRDGQLAFDRAVRDELFESAPRNSFFGTLGSLALACEWARVEKGVARRVFDRLSPFAGEFAVLGFGSYCWGSVDRFLGVVAGTVGDAELAAYHFDQCISSNLSCGAMPALAHALTAKARMQRRLGVKVDDGCEQRAGEIAARLGMRRLKAQVDAQAAGAFPTS